MKHIDALLRKYPLMTGQDIAKCVYQSVMGAGHFAPDRETAMRRLMLEIQEIGGKKVDEEYPRPEYIGRDMFRLPLTYVTQGLLSPQTYLSLFLMTACKTGDKEGLESDLAAACTYVSSAADAEYIKEYIKNGCPNVHHSDQYKKAYNPHYRIVRRDLVRFLPLFIALDSRKNTVLGIDGDSGAGKTSLANILQEIYSCNVFHADDFFLPESRKTKQRLLQPGGNIDYERMQGLLCDIRSGGSFSYGIFDCGEGKVTKTVWVEPANISVVEGVYSTHDTLWELYDMTVLMTVDEKKQRERIKNRSGEAMLVRYENEWLPLERKYFEHKQKNIYKYTFLF